MQIGFVQIGVAYSADPAMIREICRHVERLGFATIWSPEHPALFRNMGCASPYDPSEVQGEFPAEISLMNPRSALSFAAALTSCIRLGTAVTLVPQHHPLHLTKEIATVDRLCDGRFVFGIGLGWAPAEYEALGIPWERRGARLVEYLHVMRRLWEGEITFHGEFISLEGAVSVPRPERGARLPVLGGGNSDIALKRAVTHCDGWLGFNIDVDETVAAARRLRELLNEAGRNPEEFEISMSSWDKPPSPSQLKKLHGEGITEVALRVDLPETPDGVEKALERVASAYMEKAAALD